MESNGWHINAKIPNSNDRMIIENFDLSDKQSCESLENLVRSIAKQKQENERIEKKNIFFFSLFLVQVGSLAVCLYFDCC